AGGPGRAGARGDPSQRHHPVDHLPAPGSPRADRVTGGASGRPETIDPSRLARLVVEATAAAGALLLCSDFDGSLAPITDRPAEAMALPEAGRALGWLSR